MFFIGQTRFSIFQPNKVDWRASNGRFFSNDNEYRRYLYSKERLALREQIFFQLSLPLLASAAKKFRVKHIVSFGEGLPESTIEKLKNAALEFPFLVLDSVSERSVPRYPHHLASEFAAFPGEVYGYYRLDDDDLICSSFFEKIAPYITNDNVGMRISLASGYTGFFDGSAVTNLRAVYWPMLAIGLTEICRVTGDRLEKPEPSPHQLSDRVGPVIVDARTPSYLWVRHENQDTGIGESSGLQSILNSLKRYDFLAEPRVIQDEFSTLCESVKLPKSQVLAENLELGTSPRVSLGEARAFDVFLSLSCSDQCTPTNALISLTLQYDDGSPVNDRIEGLGLSSNKDVGHYVYVQTVAGDSEVAIPFILPQGISCTDIQIQRWGTGKAPILLRQAQIFRGSSD